ncbi:hypothetical protein HYU06_06740 [Candidatus Woesearchaeota archaeon]|nr:hypothetical protein [Candidatus Woesearchaeota archaeon]
MFNTNQTSLAINIKDQIIAIIKSHGPVIPKDLTKKLKIDTVFAGAHLSELVENKKLIVSTAKIGGSPVYFLPDQKDKLEMLYRYLNEKDKAAFDSLKQNKILRDIEQPPLIRVALRNLKDFAVQLTVNLPSGQETFWKWYLLTKDEAEHLIKSKMNLLHDANKQHQDHQARLDTERQRIEQEKKRVEEERKRAEEEKLRVDDQKKNVEEEMLKIERERHELLQQKQELERLKQEKTRMHEPVKEILKINSQITEIKQDNEIKNPVTEPKKRGRPKKQQQEKSIAPINVETFQLTKPEKKQENRLKDVQQTIPSVPSSALAQPLMQLKPIGQQIIELNDSFLSSIKSHFDSKQITIDSFSLNRRNSDFDLIITLSTPVGQMQYFCSAKNKQKCNEGDLSAAFVQAQLKKLPLLFLSTGELTKKAKSPGTAQETAVIVPLNRRAHKESKIHAR